MSGYIGNTPIPQATQTRDSFTATANQTSFATGGYTPNFLDVYLNGLKLNSSQFTATNGTDVVLTSAASANDIVEVIAYTAFEVADASFDDLALGGDLTVGGTVDGRDIAADGTKLDGIESGATGDQTNAEIRAAVEAATDSNVFTDADHTKLNAIEASATADQTAAEIRTLVESATDSNVFTDADHTKLNAIESGATADQTAAEIKTLVGSATDSNVFTDADHTKLNGIEASATADQTKSDIEGLGIDVPATNLTGTIPAARLSTAITQAESDDSTKIATTAYVVDKITTLIGGAPSTLNDLNELAAAINDDANYNSTLTTALATKLPLAGGTLTGNVTFGDNNKAIFGAGSDLQIYHDGVSSYIDDAGTGNLKIRASNMELLDASGNDYITMVDGGSGGTVRIKHLGSTVLTTTSTGIDVTGTVTSDGLTVSTSNPEIEITNAGQRAYSFNVTGTSFYLKDKSDAQNIIKVDEGGDISFYEDTGSQAKFFWDASAERLGLGGTTYSQNSSEKLSVFGRTGIEANGSVVLGLDRQTSDGDILQFRKDNATVGSIGTANGYMELGSSDTGIRFYTPSDAVIPANPATNSARDAAIDLGISSQRFKDLHLSGGVNYASGTLNYTGTSVPTGGNNQGLYIPTSAIGLGGTYGSLNFPTTSSALTTTAWWMLGRSGGSNDQFTLRVRRGGTAAADQTAYVVTTSGADNGKIVDSHKWYTGGSNGTERMRINSSGRVEVGTASNATAMDANIRLNTHYGSLNTARGGIQIHDGAGVTGQIDTRYNGSRVDMHFGSLYSGGYNSYSRMVITGDGKVGIGTSNPSAKLDITSFNTGQGLKLYYGNSSGTIEAINFGANNGANGVIGMQMVSQGVGDLWLGGSSGRSLTLYRDGKVGVGTSSPSTDFEVRVSTSSAIRVSGGSNTNYKTEIGYDNTNGPYIKAGSSGIQSLQFYVDNSSLALTLASNRNATFAQSVTATTFHGDGSNLTGVGGSTTLGAVGTYALLAASSYQARVAGTTVSGSNLKYANAYSSGSGNGNHNVSPSGTWRVMGNTGYYSGTSTYLLTQVYQTTVCVRIS